MPDFSEWGAAESPTRMIDLDQQNRALNQLKMLGMQADLANAPAHAALLRAQAEHAQAQAAALRNEIETQAAVRRNYAGQPAMASLGAPDPEQAAAFPAPGLAEVSQREGLPIAPSALASLGGSQSPIASVIEPLKRMYAAQTAAGDFKAASQTAGHLSTLIGTDSRIARDNSTVAYHKLLDTQRKIKIAADIIAPIKDQASLDAAAAQYEAAIGEPAPWAGQSYSPDLVAGYQQTAMSAHERASLELQKLEADRRASDRERRLIQGSIANDIRKKVAESTIARNEVLTKAGGANAGAPTREMIDSTTGILRKEAPGLPDIVGAAREIAGIAKLKQKANPALDWGAAVRATVAEERAAGNLQVNSGKASYNRGTSPADAIPIPADKRTWRQNTHYLTPKGIALYLGKDKWQLVEKPPAGVLQRAAGFVGMGPSADLPDEED